MNCEFRKLEFESPETIDKLFINTDNSIALADKEGGIRLYMINEDDDEPILITSYQDHKGPVMDAAFSSIAHPFYILTCSYDRSISLRSRECQVFNYKEDDTSMGFFVCCTFVKTKGNVLRFLVGNSSGHIFDFDSRNGFTPVKYALFNESITAIDSTADDCVLVSSSNKAPRIYLDKNFTEFISVGDESAKEKYKVARMVGDKFDAKLLLVTDNNRLEIYRINMNNREIEKEAQFQYEDKILASMWNFSTHSANLLVFNSDKNHFELRMIKEDLGSLGNWEVSDIASEIAE